MKASVYIATSLDGFIARKDGSVDWLNEANAVVPEDEDCGFQTFMNSVDTLIMGRKTYEQVLTFVQWPYGSKPVIVLSRNQISFSSAVPDTVNHSSEQPRALLQRLSNEGIEQVYIDGGVTIQSFLSDGLIDQITIRTLPPEISLFSAASSRGY